jgi:peptidoglycan L-alanyl-D-glutamate endopeptidase CwlK
MRNTDAANFAPCARASFLALEAKLEGDTPFLLFEGYRSPEDQSIVLARGTSKAGPMESAHQFGLAADFVPFIDGNWRWDVEAGLWTRLTVLASECGLLAPLAWDRAHIEHPAWKRVRLATR